MEGSNSRCLQWHSQRGAGATTPRQKICPPRPPNEITLRTEVYGEPPFWVPVSPPAHPWAPLAAPSFWKVWLRPWVSKMLFVPPLFLRSVVFKALWHRTLRKEIDCSPFWNHHKMYQSNSLFKLCKFHEKINCWFFARGQNVLYTV